jgi:hypothetical protein
MQATGAVDLEPDLGTPKFEIPTDMRKMTEQSMEQVKTAISAYVDFWKRNVPENFVGGSVLSDKILAYAEMNVASAFDFAGRAGAGAGCPGTLQAAGGLHSGANAGDDRAGEESERDYNESDDGQLEGADKGRAVVLIAKGSPSN